MNTMNIIKKMVPKLVFNFNTQRNSYSYPIIITDNYNDLIKYLITWHFTIYKIIVLIQYDSKNKLKNVIPNL